jgi:hypothetical protein
MVKSWYVSPLHMKGDPNACARSGEQAGVGRVGQATCGVVSVGVAIVALVFGYSGVVAVVSVVPLLSTTAIVFTLVFLWLVAWLVLVVTLSLVQARLTGPMGA